MVIRRRMYTDPDGRSRFALDEYLGLKPKQLASPPMTQSVVSLSAEMPFRKVVETVSSLTACELSQKTVHRLVQSVGGEALAEERERWEAQFERGEDVCDGSQQVETLYTEADGVWVHLQREERSRHEVKSAIAYSGWRGVGEDRYELVDKRVYCHAEGEMPFWEGASLEWAKQYALDRVNRFVVGGDGATWIGSGAEEFGNSVFQLDGFHLSRACGRGYGRELGSVIYRAIRSGDDSFAAALMSAAEPAETATAAANRRYVLSKLTDGVDWRNRVSDAPADARSLGTMESNGDKLTANRMKKRGMSWTVRGANRMGKVIQLSRNGELGRYCRRRPTYVPVRRERRPQRRDRSASRARSSDWAEASAPSLSGPHSSRPWVSGLRSLIRQDNTLI